MYHISLGNSENDALEFNHFTGEKNRAAASNVTVALSKFDTVVMTQKSFYF